MTDERYAALRRGIERMERRRKVNAADYGPITIWPDTARDLLEAKARLEAAEREHHDVLADAFGKWQADRYRVARLSSLLAKEQARGDLLEEKSTKLTARLEAIARLDYSGTWEEVARWCERTAREALSASPGEPEAQEPGGVWLEQRQVETLREAAIHGRSSLFDLVRSALPAEEPCANPDDPHGGDDPHGHQ